MGIPKMFRFLTDRYPLILQSLSEEDVFDNFYLDMNGIIHQCTHPDDSEIAILDIEVMYEAIFNYTDRLFRIVAPRKLMFLAVDGVAPRAKMNQQRARRFRSAKDAERSMLEAMSRGDEIPDGVPFDSNCITPGTEFMTELSLRFREWIDKKMKTDPAWQQGCTVVFSGSEVPGEGEHKLVDYIRKWRNSPEYDPAVRHCMYGLDADLMMLGLVAHVPHFTLLREKMRFGRKGVRKVPKMKGTNSDAEEFNLLEIALLRDMLFIEFTRPVLNNEDPTKRPDPNSSARNARSDQPRRLSSNDSRNITSRTSARIDVNGMTASSNSFEYDSKRVVDDFVFMCMLVGNDFLPNIPHLDIAEGGLNLMFRIYKEMVVSWRGYLTQEHRLHPDRLQAFLTKVAESERQYFENRAFDDGIPEYKTDAYGRTYYLKKFGFDIEGPDGPERLSHIRKIFMEGLHWCLQYYHRGVTSWNWFYPDFYAPLASDMVELKSLKISFKKGKPFSPITQLMAVLPPHSAQFLPPPMRNLMVNPTSPVRDFYPPDFEVDQNGKRNSWEAVVIIPFIDEYRLLTEIGMIDQAKELTVNERKRDILGIEHWFYADDYPKAKTKIRPVRPSQFKPQRVYIRGRSASPDIGRSNFENRPGFNRTQGRSQERGRSDRRTQVDGERRSQQANGERIKDAQAHSPQSNRGNRARSPQSSYPEQPNGFEAKERSGRINGGTRSKSERDAEHGFRRNLSENPEDMRTQINKGSSDTKNRGSVGDPASKLDKPSRNSRAGGRPQMGTGSNETSINESRRKRTPGNMGGNSYSSNDDSDNARGGTGGRVEEEWDKKF